MTKLYKYFQYKNNVTRREFYNMVKQQVVYVNGEVVSDVNHQISRGDSIKIQLPDGDVYEETVSKIYKHPPSMVVLNKPKGYVVSKKDPHNKTIYELLPDSWQRDFYYIGRLDKDSHGLMLLTNRPKLVDYYENPKNNVLKKYRVRINKKFNTKDIKKVNKGIWVDQNGTLVKKDDKGKILNPDELDGKLELLKYKFIDFLDRESKENKTLVRIGLTEGKKRHIRRSLKALGYKVEDLKRTKFDKFSLGDIKEGKYRLFELKFKGKPKHGDKR